jgi:predicted P-loop ATPase
MVSVGKHTNIEWVRANRDRIWAAAKALYDSGEPWWFNYETECAVMERADEYRQTDPWEEVLAEFLPAIKEGGSTDEVQDQTVKAMLFRYEGGSRPTTFQLLQVLGIPVERQSRSDQVRLGAVMEALGWRRSSASVNGVVKKVWRC